MIGYDRVVFVDPGDVEMHTPIDPDDHRVVEQVPASDLDLDLDDDDLAAIYDGAVAAAIRNEIERADR